MNGSHKLANLQQSVAQKYSQKSTTHSFFNILTSPELFDVVESLLPEHRERNFPPTETLSMFLAQAMSSDSSCQNIVNEVALSRAMNGFSSFSSNTGSYCKARSRLPLPMVSELVRETGSQMSSHSPEHWHWKGRPLRLVDGTTVDLPDTIENQNIFPQNKNKKGCPLARIVSIICLASGGVMNAAIGPVCGKGASEQGLLREMLDTLKPGEILLGDAFYSTYFLFTELRERKVDAVFEQLGARKRVTDFRRGTKLGSRDHLITYKKPYKPDWMSEEKYVSIPETITIRELKVGHKILVTTFLSPKSASKHELNNCYQQRWHIEVDFRNIKTTLGLTKLSCKTPEMAEKEIWIYLLAHNLIRVIMAEAASLSDILPRQLSFKHSLQLFRVWRQLPINQSNGDDLRILILLIVERTVGDRPGRVEPRAVKRWIKTFPVLSKPRAEMRKSIRLHGHPQKHK
jgi:Transposase DDE domain